MPDTHRPSDDNTTMHDTTPTTLNDDQQQQLQQKTIHAAKEAARNMNNAPVVHDRREISILKPFVDTLLNTDKHGILSMLDNDDAICMETIQAKLDEYSSIAEFKHDLQLAFHTVLPKLANHSPQRREALDKLHEFAMATLRFESQRLLKRKSHEREGQDQMVMDTFDDQQQQVALFRPTMDGFVFTDAVPSAFLDRKERLPGGVQEMAIYPTPSTAEVPSLRNTVPPPPRFPSRIHRHEDKHTVPIQWLDYGVFSSFAPTRDSNHANISYEHTYMGRVAKRFKRWEKKQRNLQTLGKPTSPPKSVAMKNGVSKDDSNTTTTENNDNKDEIDTQWLKEQGLDVDAILDAAQSGSVNVDDLIGNDEKDIEGVLERNSELLSYLSQYQEYRFGLGDARWGSIDETERNIAKALEKRMHKLASKVAPKDLTESEAVEAAMDRLPLREPAYRGSLPPNKPFAYPTNEQVEPIPPLANLLPGYPKERWKLVDVAPVPNKEKQHYHPQQQQQKRPPHPHPSASSSSSSSSPSPYRPSPS